MPFSPAPNVIEQSEWGGLVDDAETVSLEPKYLTDVSNLLPDVGGSGSMVTRKGFRRLTSALGGTSSHYIRHIFPYRKSGTSYLICVETDGSANANNVRLYQVNLSTFAVTRIDTVGRIWANPTADHWGITIQDVYYGGSPGNDVYSWDGSTWTPQANIGSYNTLVDSLSPGAGETARDFAFKGTEKVFYNSGKVYTPAHGIRFDTWESGRKYTQGERVSQKTAIGGQTYWRSYKAVQTHESASGVNDPATDTGNTYWEKIRLPLPVNADGETSDRWYFVPVAPGSSVAEWHHDRFWIRYDGEGDKSRVLFSAPLTFEKGADVADVEFHMTDFAPGNDEKGPGGGWIPFNDGRSGGVVEAMHSYGQYLLVFKRQAVWVLSGLSEESFSVRRLVKGVGAIGPFAVTELDGLVYWLGDDGLYVTDGTAYQPVAGFDNILTTIRSRIDDQQVSDSFARNPMVFNWEDKVWVAIPDSNSSTKYLTYVYDPKSASWWKTTLPIVAARRQRITGVDHLYFSSGTDYGSGKDLVFEYNHASANDQDDTAGAAYAAQDFTWKAVTTWWPFGLVHAERRIRRTWAVVKGVMTFTLKTYRDWVESVTSTTTRVNTGSTPTHIEGQWIPDSHALKLELSSTKAPAAVYGIAVHTEPRRVRYHRG